jgi:hypothetical protein
MTSGGSGRLGENPTGDEGTRVTRGRFDIPATVTTVASDGTTLDRRAGAPAPARLSHVDALARLALAAHRHGAHLQVAGAAEDLHRLIALAGLAEVLGLQPQGQAELLEDGGPDEVVQAADPPV